MPTNEKVSNSGCHYCYPLFALSSCSAFDLVLNSTLLEVLKNTRKKNYLLHKLERKLLYEIQQRKTERTKMTLTQATKRIGYWGFHAGIARKKKIRLACFVLSCGKSNKRKHYKDQTRLGEGMHPQRKHRRVVI